MEAGRKGQELMFFMACHTHSQLCSKHFIPSCSFYPLPDPSSSPVPVGAQSSGVQKSGRSGGLAANGARLGPFLSLETCCSEATPTQKTTGGQSDGAHQAEHVGHGSQPFSSSQHGSCPVFQKHKSQGPFPEAPWELHRSPTNRLVDSRWPEVLASSTAGGIAGGQSVHSKTGSGLKSQRTNPGVGAQRS